MFVQEIFIWDVCIFASLFTNKYASCMDYTIPGKLNLCDFVNFIFFYFSKVNIAFGLVALGYTSVSFEINGGWKDVLKVEHNEN